MGYSLIIAGITYLLTLAIGSCGGTKELGWAGSYTPQIGEPCTQELELRCEAPFENSKRVLQCDGGEWTPYRECSGFNTCNWASSSEAYCAGFIER